MPILRYQLEGATVVFFGREPPAHPEGKAGTRPVFEPPPSAWNRQVHSDRVVRVNNPGFTETDADGLVTTTSSLGLRLVTADCLPVFLAQNGQLAAVHAGWRGLAQRILERALQQFDPALQTRAVIGPSIGPCCYEVDEKTAQEVDAASLGSGTTIVDRSPRPHLDLQQAARLQLTQLGVQIDPINSETPCTRCHSADYWSYRRNGPGAGRNYSFGWLD